MHGVQICDKVKDDDLVIQRLLIIDKGHDMKKIKKTGQKGN